MINNMFGSPQATATAEAKLNQVIAKGREAAGEVIAKIMRDVPQDRVVPSGAMAFTSTGEGVELVLPEQAPQPLHRHAASQAAERVGMPLAWMDHLLGQPGWGLELLANSLTQGWSHRRQERALVLAEIHLGRQLTDAMFSQETFALDTQTSVSAVRDVVRGYLTEGKTSELLGRLTALNQDNLTPQAVGAILKARGLTKAEQEDVKRAYTSADIEMMPAGATTYRLANAISWVANQRDDRTAKLDLMRVAGEVLERGASAPVAAAA